MRKNSQTSTEFENNWLSKSLDSLEKLTWPTPDPNEGSHLVKTCHSLRKKQLKDFTIEDLRIMIGQDIGLKFLIPIAIDRLTENILVEGDFYPGDLLKSVLTSNKKFWNNNRDNWTSICDLFEKNLQTLEKETSGDIKKGLFNSYRDFKNAC